MANFIDLFGIDSSEVKETCVLSPFLYKGLTHDFGLNNLSKGARYAAASTDDLTLIHTQIGALQVGDCVLHLKETNCKNVILFGACGAVNNHYKVGTIVTPKKAYNYESFSSLINDEYITPDYYEADSGLLSQCYGEHASCASLGSVNLEKDYILRLKQNDIGVIDMETCSLYAACQKSFLHGLAILYVTDHIEKSDVFDKKSAEDYCHISEAQKKCIELIKDLNK